MGTNVPNANCGLPEDDHTTARAEQQDAHDSRKKRRHPAHGVLIIGDQPTIVFVTVCTKYRIRWLATPEVHCLLREVWTKATAWLVGRYVVMPDHIHLFAAPNDTPITLDKWITYWKSQFSKRHGVPEHRWLTDHWDTRLRHEESYDQKWEYVRRNPVRHGLVGKPEDRPFQGEIHALRWE